MKPGEGSLHPRPEGRGIRDSPRSRCNKTDEEIVEGLMEITALSLTDVLADEPAYE
jgi:hypothetical protein